MSKEDLIDKKFANNIYLCILNASHDKLIHPIIWVENLLPKESGYKRQKSQPK
jgi:hypothetical protein